MIEAEPRSRRDRPAKAPLSRAVIVDAALELAADDGVEGVTLRRVARALDTGPASLYVYIANRDDLLQRMLDRAVSEVSEIAVKPKRWRRRLIVLFNDVLEALDRYPGIAEVALGSAASSPSAAAVTENAIALLRVGGIEDPTAAWACEALWLHTVATAARRAVERRERGAALSGDGDGDDGERFTFALAALIEGAR